MRPPSHHTITIDDRYDCYIRKLYTREVPLTGKFLVSNLRMEDGIDGLVEIEYLLLSAKNEKAIYLTMVQDKKQQFYEKHYLGDQYLNCYDFRNFLFGTVKKDTITFQSKKNVDSKEEWALRFSLVKDTVFVHTIIETKSGEFAQSLPVERTLEKGIGFVKIKPPQMVFHEPKFGNAENIIPVENKFFFYKKGGKERLQILLSEKVKNYRIIYFKGNRIPYRADSVYDINQPN